jgi:hypothetical protein
MNNQLTNFTDQEILAEAMRRVEKGKTIDLLKDLGQKIQNGKINNY